MPQVANVPSTVEVNQLTPIEFADALRELTRGVPKPETLPEYREMVRRATDHQIRAYANLISRKKAGGAAHRTYVVLVQQRAKYEEETR